MFAARWVIHSEKNENTVKKMFRASVTFLGEIPLYHRRSMPLGKGLKWHGNWGASGRFHGRASQIEAVTPRRSVAAIDRDMINYVHRLRIRHRQMRTIFSRKTPSQMRLFEKKEVHLRAWLRKFQLSYRAYVHYATMRVLREQAGLVNKYGQAAVNRALGDFGAASSSSGSGAAGAAEPEGKMRLLQSMHRAVRTPAPSRPVKRHVVTRFQKHNDRFDMWWRQGQK